MVGCNATSPCPSIRVTNIYFYIFMNITKIFIFSVDLSLAMSTLPKIFATTTQLWLSQKAEVTTAATHTLEVLLKDAITPACCSEQLVQQYHSKLLTCFNLLEQGLSYQYHNVWNQVLYILKVMFEVNLNFCLFDALLIQFHSGGR